MKISVKNGTPATTPFPLASRKRFDQLTHAALAPEEGLLVRLADDKAGPVKAGGVLGEPLGNVLLPAGRKEVGELLARKEVGRDLSGGGGSGHFARER